jgi:hypothetical protein
MYTLQAPHHTGRGTPLCLRGSSEAALLRGGVEVGVGGEAERQQAVELVGEQELPGPETAVLGG